MNETIETPEMSPSELAGRLMAQRRVLQWLLTHVAKENVDVSELLDDLNETWPPADAQEDPGAVPADGFAILSAATAEMRLLLEPLKHWRKSVKNAPAAGGRSAKS